MVQRLRQTRTQIEADLLISRLRAAGLHPSDLRVWPHVTLAGADLFYGVEVPAEEVESANELIQASEGDAAPTINRDPRWVVMRLAVASVIAAIAAGMLLP